MRQGALRMVGMATQPITTRHPSAHRSARPHGRYALHLHSVYSTFISYTFAAVNSVTGGPFIIASSWEGGIVF